MLELMETYTIEHILLIIVVAALGFKGLISFFDWAVARMDAAFTKKNENQSQFQKYDECLKKEECMIQELIEYNKTLSTEINDIKCSLKTLLDSDRDDIKLCITEKYHKYVEGQGWVDDYTMECLERRFACYQREGGNSYVEGMMTKLRELPRSKPE